MKFLKFTPILLFVFLLSYCSEDNPTPTPQPDPAQVSIADVTVGEGDAYATVAIQLTLDKAATDIITATISSSDGTAEAGIDYIGFSNEVVTFSAGATQQTFDITIAGDFLFEENETFEVAIGSVTGPATIDDGTATVELTNDDTEGTNSVQEVDPVVDWTSFETFPVNTEVTYEIFNFGQPANVPNAEFTSTLTPFDEVNVNEASSPTGDTLLYLNFEFDDPNYTERLSLFTIVTGFENDSVTSGYSILAVSDTMEVLEYKYDFQIMIGTPSGRLGPFNVDPKIRIPSSQ